MTMLSILPWKMQVFFMKRDFRRMEPEARAAFIADLARSGAFGRSHAVYFENDTEKTPPRPTRERLH